MSELFELFARAMPRPNDSAHAENAKHRCANNCPWYCGAEIYERDCQYPDCIARESAADKGDSK